MNKCKSMIDGGRTCTNGFSQNDFCEGKGVAANIDVHSNHYKIRKECYPQCLWDDGVTQGLTK